MRSQEEDENSELNENELEQLLDEFEHCDEHFNQLKTDFEKQMRMLDVRNVNQVIQFYSNTVYKIYQLSNFILAKRALYEKAPEREPNELLSSLRKEPNKILSELDSIGPDDRISFLKKSLNNILNFENREKIYKVDRYLEKHGTGKEVWSRLHYELFLVCKEIEGTNPIKRFFSRIFGNLNKFLNKLWSGITRSTFSSKKDDPLVPLSSFNPKNPFIPLFLTKNKSPKNKHDQFLDVRTPKKRINKKNIKKELEAQEVDRQQPGGPI